MMAIQGINYIKTIALANWCLDNSNFSKIQGRVFPSQRTRYLMGRFGRDHPMKNYIAINDRDEASVDQIITIKSKSFDRR